MQHLPKSKEIEVAIADLGVGIPHSMRQSKQAVGPAADDLLMIQLALTATVTSTPWRNSGYGLTYTGFLLAHNEGRLLIRSGSGHVIRGSKRVDRLVEQSLPGRWSQCASGPTVHLTSRLPTIYCRELSSRCRAITMKCKHKMKLAESYGSVLTGRAYAAEIVERVARDIARGESVEIDFSDVHAVSPSFADELFGKLAARVDISDVRFTNLSEHLQSVARMAAQRRRQSDSAF